MMWRWILFLVIIWMPMSSRGLPLAGDFISKMLSSSFPQHKLLLFYGDFGSNNYSWRSRDRLEEVIGSPGVMSDSGGLSHVRVDSNQTDDLVLIERRPKLLGEVGQVVLLLLPVGIPSIVEERILNKSLILPLLGPPTVKNVDKFIVVTGEPYLGSIFGSKFFTRLKFKLVLTEKEGGILRLHQFCLHCPLQDNIIEVGLQLPSFRPARDYFPDFQQNFFGHVLKASATDKMYGNLEFAKDPATGKKYAKRGIFASILTHLSTGLNFSGEAFPSSGGGATGTLFPNGSWVGSVGDVYYGGATFCMLCSISLNRHMVIDMCSPVTYEYVTFAIGPPGKVYSWEAIFWPFQAHLWIALIGITCFNMLCCYLFLKWDLYKGHCSKFSIASVTQYLGRIFLEQSDDLPISLPTTIRISFAFWLLFSLVATNLYRAKMVTFMTFPVFENVPSSFDELVKTDYEIQFHWFPNIAYNTLKLSTNPVYKATFQRLIKEPDPVKCMGDTLRSKSVCIMFTSVHEDTISRNMSDQHGRSPITAAKGYAFLYTPGIVLEKMADVMPNFKWILQNSLEMGLNDWWRRSDAMILQKWKNDWMRKPENKGKSFNFDFDGDDVMHLKHLKGAFRVLFGGIVGAMAVFLGEKAGRITRNRMEEWRDRKQLKLGSNDGESPLGQSETPLELHKILIKKY